MEALAKEFAGKATIAKLDLDTLWVQSRRLKQQFNIPSIPLLIIFENGREVARLSGGDNTTKDKARAALLAVLEKE